jgi:hypothetical protein
MIFAPLIEYYSLFTCIYKKQVSKNSLLYAPKLINKNMETHYQKYKETIKKVARRNYRKRVQWLNNSLADQCCIHCGESETICLKLYPHDVEIRKQAKRVGSNDESRKDIHKLMNECKVVCTNCWIKLDNDLIEFL